MAAAVPSSTNSARPSVSQSISSLTSDLRGIYMGARQMVEREICRQFSHNILVTNPLSFAWNRIAIKKNPKTILVGLALYPIGMVGYAWDLASRISWFAHALFNFLKEFLSHIYGGKKKFEENQELKFRLLILGGTTGELVSGIIGCVCPPIAYKMDEWIQTNPTIYQYYYNGFLPKALWSKPEEFLFKPLLQCCTQARISFQDFVRKDFLDSSSASLLPALAEGGMLFAFHKGVDLLKIEKKFLDQIESQSDTDATLAIQQELRPTIIKELHDDPQFQLKLEEVIHDAVHAERSKEFKKRWLDKFATPETRERFIQSGKQRDCGAVLALRNELVTSVWTEMQNDSDFQKKLEDLSSQAVIAALNKEADKRVSEQLKTPESKTKIIDKKKELIEGAQKDILFAFENFNTKTKILTEEKSLQKQKIVDLLIKKIILECRAADTGTDEEFFIRPSQKTDLNKEFTDLSDDVRNLIDSIYTGIKKYTGQFITKERTFLQLMGDYL